MKHVFFHSRCPSSGRWRQGNALERRGEGVREEKIMVGKERKGRREKGN